MRRNFCGPIEADFIYLAYSDIPEENIRSGIESAIHKGWIREKNNRSLLYLSARGLSEISSTIPKKILDARKLRK